MLYIFRFCKLDFLVKREPNLSWMVVSLIRMTCLSHESVILHEELMVMTLGVHKGYIKRYPFKKCCQGSVDSDTVFTCII